MCLLNVAEETWRLFFNRIIHIVSCPVLISYLDNVCGHWTVWFFLLWEGAL
jgi:hypothetical protein